MEVEAAVAVQRFKGGKINVLSFHALSLWGEKVQVYLCSSRYNIMCKHSLKGPLLKLHQKVIVNFTRYNKGTRDVVLDLPA